ncbi:MAG: DMT family transporter [Arcanobacterium sp.]|nr:DMT family transporter [Arcanobacterium sp.]
MYYGILSGILWALDTTIMGFALALMILQGAQGIAPAIVVVFLGPLLHDLLSALFVTGINASRGRAKETYSALKTKGGKIVALGALLGGPIGMTGYVISINHIGSAYTAVLTAFYPAFGAIVAYFLLRDRLKFFQVIGLCLAIIGITGISYLTTSPENVSGTPWIGLFGAAVTIIGWGGEAVIYSYSKKASDIPTDIALEIRQSISAVTYLLITIPLAVYSGFTINHLNFFSLWLFALAAIVGSLSYYCYYSAIERIGPTRAMALNISYSAWAIVFTAIITLTFPSILAIICCLAIIFGSTLAAHFRNNKSNTPA